MIGQKVTKNIFQYLWFCPCSGLYPGGQLTSSHLYLKQKKKLNTFSLLKAFLLIFLPFLNKDYEKCVVFNLDFNLGDF